MRRVSSDQALAAIKRGDAQALAQFLRGLTASAIKPDANCTNALAASFVRISSGSLPVLNALAETLDAASLQPQRLHFKRRSRGKPPAKPDAKRALEIRNNQIMIAICKIEIEKLTKGIDQLEHGAVPPEREIVNRKEIFERVAARQRPPLKPSTVRKIYQKKRMPNSSN